MSKFKVGDVVTVEKQDMSPVYLQMSAYYNAAQQGMQNSLANSLYNQQTNQGIGNSLLGGTYTPITTTTGNTWQQTYPTYGNLTTTSATLSTGNIAYTTPPYHGPKVGIRAVVTGVLKNLKYPIEIKDLDTDEEWEIMADCLKKEEFVTAMFAPKKKEVADVVPA